MPETFDNVWEERYRNDASYRTHYPWSSVVSFVFTCRPRERAPGETTILEIGCGNGNNLWFAAREGFQVAGVDGSSTAVGYAREWFEREALQGDLRVGDFTDLPFADASFDLAFDRAALSLTTVEGAQAAMAELRRVVRKGGRILLTPYSDRCSGFHSMPDAHGVVRGIDFGSVTGGGGQVRFYGLTDAKKLVEDGWKILSLKHVEEVEMAKPARMVHGEWHLLAERV